MISRLILFDIDGTLIHPAGAGRNALARAFREVLDGDILSEPASRVPFAGHSDLRIIRSLGASLGIDESRVEDAMPEVIKRYLEHLRREMAEDHPERGPLDGVPEALAEFEQRQGVSCGLLTGNVEAGARIKLERYDLNRFFATGGFGSDGEDRRDIARAAHRRMCEHDHVEYPPSRVYVVGDTEFDVDCAHANGFRAIAVDTGFTPRERLLAARPDALLAGFRPLAPLLSALGLTG